MDVLYLIMLHIDRNGDKKFQPSIFYEPRKSRFPKKLFRQTDISNDRIASQIKTYKEV